MTDTIGTTIDYAKAHPVIDEFSRPFWDACREERLLIQRCRACARFQFYPRIHCTSCFARDPEWHEAAGTGKLYTFSVAYRSWVEGFTEATPYVCAIVELDEGVHMSTNIVGVPFDDLACDMPVKVLFEYINDEYSVPLFTAV